MLYEARRQSGMDINTISRKLHIRPDILHAMEEGDFERLPDRGYARNMVRGYAHIVGLDQNLISQMYLEELHMYETGRPLATSADAHRQASQSRRSGAEGVTRSTSAKSESPRRTASTRTYTNNPRNQGSRQRQGSSRRVYDAGQTSVRTQNPSSNRNSSRRDGSSDVTASRSGARSSSARNDSMRAYKRPSQDSKSRRKSPSANVPLTSLFASNFGKKKQPGGQSARPGVPSVYTQNKRSTPSVAQPTLKMSFLVVVALIAIILIVLAIVFSSGSKQTVDEVPQIPISGLTDTSGSTQGTSTTTSDAASNADTSTDQTQTQTNELTCTIEDGARTWVQIAVDGEDDPLVEEVLEGPLTKTIDVESTVTFKTANPSPITLTFNSKQVELTRLSGTEYYTYTAKPDTQSEASSTASSSASASSSSSTTSGSSSSEE
jgi:cytoskeletal protein RodZ